MVVCVPVGPDGAIDPRWGRAHRVAVAQVEEDGISDWQEFEVNWDALHDEGTEGSHHARVTRFLRDHRVEAVAAGHMGPPMVNMLHQMGLTIRLGASGDARQAAMAAIR